MRAGKPEDHKQAIFDGFYRALRETFDVPAFHSIGGRSRRRRRRERR